MPKYFISFPFYLLVMIIFTGCGKGDIDYDLINRVDQANAEQNLNIDHDDIFNLPQFDNQNSSKKLRLWATYYSIPVISETSSGISVRNKKNQSLGFKISHKNWCRSAMEGSFIVKRTNGNVETYTYAGTSAAYKIKCKQYYNHDTSRTKFARTKHTYGTASNGAAMQPYRVIAIDRKIIPRGSVLYIPEARGNEITLPNGKIEYHDGYFYAADVGGAIKGTHIDVFIGTASKNPFKWVGNKASKKFDAYIVKDKSIIEHMKIKHLLKK